MKVYVKYDTDPGYGKKSDLDLSLMYYELADTTDGPFHFRPIVSLQTLGWIIKRNDPIFVLFDKKGFDQFDNVPYSVLAPKVNFIINSSKILYVQSADEESVKRLEKEAAFERGDSGFRYR